MTGYETQGMDVTRISRVFDPYQRCMVDLEDSYAYRKCSIPIFTQPKNGSPPEYRLGIAYYDPQMNEIIHAEDDV